MAVRAKPLSIQRMGSDFHKVVTFILFAVILLHITANKIPSNLLSGPQIQAFSWQV